MTGFLSAEHLTFAYPGQSVFADLSCTFAKGEISALVGPNGCGKSTLLKILAGVLTPSFGRVVLDGRVLADIPSRERARAIGLLFQENVAPFGLSVRELVLEGRYPHLGFFAQPEAEDRKKADEALALCGLEAFADRPLGALSSGQRRLAWIAMAVAQSPEWLLLDEPTTYLDVARELEVLELVRRLNRELGISVILSIHDLNAAASVADRVFAMRGGSFVATGKPTEVFVAPTLKTVFDAEATVVTHPTSGRPVVLWGER